MKLTIKCEYAILALVHLARHADEGYVTVAKIAEAQEIPPKFLEQILLIMKRARLLTSVKGQNGGYKLAKRSNEITLAEVIRLFDGALAPTESVSKYFYESTPVEKAPGVIKVFKEIRDYISDRLEKTYISDIIQ